MDIIMYLIGLLMLAMVAYVVIQRIKERRAEKLQESRDNHPAGRLLETVPAEVIHDQAAMTRKENIRRERELRAQEGRN